MKFTPVQRYDLSTAGYYEHLSVYSSQRWCRMKTTNIAKLWTVSGNLSSTLVRDSSCLIRTKQNKTNSWTTNSNNKKNIANMKFAALFCVVVIVGLSCLCDASGELPAHRARRSFDDMVKVKTVFYRWKFHLALCFGKIFVSEFPFIKCVPVHSKSVL